MRLFRRTTPAEATSNEDLDGIVGPALETLAAVVHVFGEFSFDIDTQGHEDFQSRAFAWARHVLDGSAPDPTEQSELPPIRLASHRRWDGVRRFIEHRRRDESAFVSARMGGFQSTLAEFVRGLRTIVNADRADEAQLEVELGRLEGAIKANRIDELRALWPGAVSTFRSTFKKRRERLNHELKQATERLRSVTTDLSETRRRAARDPLTQLFNRGAFDQALKQTVEMAQLSERPAALLMADLDHFKAVNDRHGHPVGDRVLRATADQLVRTFPRRNDVVARYGGEEFVVLLLDCEAADLPKLGERLRGAVRATRVSVNGKILDLRCSVGGASLRPDDTPQTFLTRADKALYQAKNDGRDQICVA